MAGNDSGDKTHDPTEKKLSDARKKGDVAGAPEMRHASMFVAALVALGSIGTFAVSQMLTIFVKLWGDADDILLDNGTGHHFAAMLLRELGIALGPLLATLLAFAGLSFFLQSHPTLAWSRLKLKWDKLSPLAGVKRLFGKSAFVEFAKTLAKFLFVATVVLTVVWPHAREIETMVGASAATVGKTAAALVVMMVKAAAILILALAVLDFLYQRHAFIKKMRMSLQEIRDEHKESDGDPKIKARIRAIGMERAKRRMMAKVSKASVIITNPTHYAVALQYDHGAMAAPVVVAKGTDEIAAKIREIAAEHGIPIVERPPLARALHANAQLDRPIPTEHYAAVAEIISYVMKLARRAR
mgnify:CR=1 FL=1